MKGSLGLRILGFFALVAPSFCLGEGLDTWQWRHPHPQGNSTNGRSWIDLTFGVPLAYYLMEISSGGGRCGAVANSGDIATSFNGQDWTTTSGLGAYPEQVAYGNGTYFIAGPTCQYSTSGT